METAANRDDFHRELARALSYLYDPTTLRRSPLLARFDLRDRSDAPVALQHLLTEAIEALKPAADTPPTANSWRLYQILRYRYVEGLTQDEVARDLALSTRHLRRLEDDAVDLLVDALRAQTRAEPGAAPIAAMPDSAAELAWLSRSLPPGADQVDAAGLVRGVLETVQPLLNSEAVRVDCSVAEGIPPLAAPAMAARQALLHTLTTAARLAPGGLLRVACGLDRETSRARITVEAHAEPGRRGAELADDDLAMIRQLATIAGSELQIRHEPGGAAPLTASFTFALLEQMTVLVVDDNADTLGLIGRYLMGTRYRFLGIADPGMVIAACELEQPRAIVVDVMLPEIDGWDLLGRLRSHPATRAIPVIVCSILSEEPLALALGAAAFLRKPVSRATLLAALESETAPARA